MECPKPEKKKKPPKQTPSAFKLLVLRLDHGCCRFCGKPCTEITIHIHHLKYKGKGGVDDVRTCISLCWECDHKAHGTIKVKGQTHDQWVLSRLMIIKSEVPEEYRFEIAEDWLRKRVERKEVAVI